jgi:hypothetical protein
MSKHLKKLANRAQDDGFFLGCLLKLYATSESLDDAKLAAKLGCPPNVLTPLRLCRAPGVLAMEFQKDVKQIAARFSLNRQALSEAVRRGQAILNMREDREGSRGTLMAARDKEPEPGEGKPEK